MIATCDSENPSYHKAMMLSLFYPFFLTALGVTLRTSFMLVKLYSAHVLIIWPPSRIGGKHLLGHILHVHCIVTLYLKLILLLSTFHSNIRYCGNNGEKNRLLRSGAFLRLEWQVACLSQELQESQNFPRIIKTF